MKTKSLLFLTIFLLSSFLYAAPQGAGIILDGTSGLTVKDFKLTGNAFTVRAWVKVKNTNESQIFVSLGEPAQDWTLYFCNKQGDVFELPRQMEGDTFKPVKKR